MTGTLIGGGVAGAPQKASGAIGGALDAMFKGAGVKGVDKKGAGTTLALPAVVQVLEQIPK